MENKVLVSNKINEFQRRLLGYYPQLTLFNKYDGEEHEIWYEDKAEEYHDNKFRNTVERLAREILFDNDIYNFTFSYEGVPIMNKVDRKLYSKRKWIKIHFDSDRLPYRKVFDYNIGKDTLVYSIKENETCTITDWEDFLALLEGFDLVDVKNDWRGREYVLFPWVDKKKGKFRYERMYRTDFRKVEKGTKYTPVSFEELGKASNLMELNVEEFMQFMKDQGQGVIK